MHPKRLQWEPNGSRQTRAHLIRQPLGPSLILLPMCLVPLVQTLMPTLLCDSSHGSPGSFHDQGGFIAGSIAFGRDGDQEGDDRYTEDGPDDDYEFEQCPGQNPHFMGLTRIYRNEAVGEVQWTYMSLDQRDFEVSSLHNLPRSASLLSLVKMGRRQC